MIRPFATKLTAVPSRLYTRQQSTIAKYLPNFTGVNSKTTLGEVWDRAYTNYRYRLAYVVLAWGGFLWYNLWVP
jgi:hypothetical protein